MYDTSPRKVLGYQVLVAIAFALLVVLARPRDGRRDRRRDRPLGRSRSRRLVRAAYYINIKKRQRFTKIDRQMPDMIDLLVVTIEAGLGISPRCASPRRR